MANYSIDNMHGDEICAGIRNLGDAQETAQRHANRLGQSVWIYGDDLGGDDDGVEVEPEPAISSVELSTASGCADVGGGNAVEDCDALYD